MEAISQQKATELRADMGFCAGSSLSGVISYLAQHFFFYAVKHPDRHKIGLENAVMPRSDKDLK